MKPILVYPIGLIVLCILLYIQSRRENIIKRKLVEENKKMTEKVLKDFINKYVSIIVYGEAEYTGVILGIDSGWIKLETKKETKLINSSLISSISSKK